MENIAIEYLGLKLKSPIIVSSSPFTATVDKIVKLEHHGAGAVVLKSIFEEQIIGESAALERYNDYPEAADYLKGYLTNDFLDEYIELIKSSKSQVSIPIIASINCVSNGDWVDYAKRIESAGADALELNIFTLPTDANLSSDAIEQQYMKIIERVVEAVKIPISVKLSMRFTNILSIASRAYSRGVKGVVFYNRFFEPDIDIESMTLVGSDGISGSSELRNSLRMVALASAQLPRLDISVSSGVHNGADAVKSLLVGAKSVQICSALYLHGVGVIGKINKFVADWKSRHGYSTVAEFCGVMNYKQIKDNQSYQRVQYIKSRPTH